MIRFFMAQAFLPVIGTAYHRQECLCHLWIGGFIP